MTGSVTVGSRKGYYRKFGKWRAYVETIPVERRPQLYLQDVDTEEKKAKWLALFIIRLGEQGVRGPKPVGDVFAAMKFYWKANGHDDLCLSSGFVKQAKKGTRLSTLEVRAKAKHDEETRLMPVFVQMLIAMRAQLWDQSGLDKIGLDMKAVYIGAAISYDSGLRPGHVTQADGPDAEDHCIRAGDFTFIVALGSVLQRLRGGEDIRAFLLVDPEVRLGQIQNVDFRVLTGKMQASGSFARDTKSIGRGSAFETLLLEDLAEWMMISNVKCEDEFVARYAPGTGTRKVVTRKELANAVKAAGEKFGFPGVKFAAKSLRSGFATHMTSSGISREDMVARGGWSLRSRVPERHYIDSFSRGAYGAAYDPEGTIAGLGAQGVWRMMPPGTAFPMR